MCSLLSYLRLIQFRYFHYGSGFFVQCFGMYVLLTCCHNFMSKTGTVVRYLEDSVLEGKIKWRCKRAEYHCSTRDLKSTVSVPAKVVLANHEDPVVVCDKVGRVDNLTELSHVG